jgi:hypothetical protein
VRGAATLSLRRAALRAEVPSEYRQSPGAVRVNDPLALRPGGVVVPLV